ncbi:MAG: bile acid:sodium symporter [Kiritimatiellia bacterium]
MINHLKKLQKNLTIVIPLVMLAGFMAGQYSDMSFLKKLIMPFTFLMVYPMMINLQIRKVFEGGDVKVQAATQLLNFTAIPLAAFGIGRIAFPDSPYIALGLLLASLLPTSGMTISWTGMARGNMPAAVKMTVFGLLIGSFLTPVYIEALMGTVIEIPMAKIFRQIMIVVVLPLVLGNLTQRFLIKRYGMAHYQKDLKPVFPPFSTLGVIGIVFIAIALKSKSISSDPGQIFTLIIPLAILYLCNFTVSTIIGKLFFSRENAIALVYGTVMRNLSIALAIAMTAFGEKGSQIALIIALAYIIQVQSAAWYVRFTDRIFGAPPEIQVRDIMQSGVFSLHDDKTLHDALRLLAEEHIHSFAVIDEDERPVGIITTSSLLDHIADGQSMDSPLKDISMEPIVLISAQASLTEALIKMKRTHEYKILILDENEEIKHVLTQDEIVQQLAA